MRETGEECDDGRANNEDGCLETCQLPVSWTTSDRTATVPAPADICYLWRSVEHLSQLATRRLWLYQSTNEALTAYQEAVAELRRRFAQSGGETCR